MSRSVDAGKQIIDRTSGGCRYRYLYSSMISTRLIDVKTHSECQLLSEQNLDYQFSVLI